MLCTRNSLRTFLSQTSRNYVNKNCNGAHCATTRQSLDATAESACCGCCCCCSCWCCWCETCKIRCKVASLFFLFCLSSSLSPFLSLSLFPPGLSDPVSVADLFGRLPGCSPGSAPSPGAAHVWPVVNPDPPCILPPCHVPVRHEAHFVTEFTSSSCPPWALASLSCPSWAFTSLSCPPWVSLLLSSLGLLLLGSRLSHLSLSLLLNTRFSFSFLSRNRSNSNTEQRRHGSYLNTIKCSMSRCL